MSLDTLQLDTVRLVLEMAESAGTTPLAAAQQLARWRLEEARAAV